MLLIDCESLNAPASEEQAGRVVRPVGDVVRSAIVVKQFLAHPRGFEPLASAFGGQRSIQLSYGCFVANQLGCSTGTIGQEQLQKLI